MPSYKLMPIILLPLFPAQSSSHSLFHSGTTSLRGWRSLLYFSVKFHKLTVSGAHGSMLRGKAERGIRYHWTFNQLNILLSDHQDSVQIPLHCTKQSSWGSILWGKFVYPECSGCSLLYQERESLFQISVWRTQAFHMFLRPF